VEYATREQAQQAVNTLSNQNLMGRLVYVREVRCFSTIVLRNVTSREHSRGHETGNTLTRLLHQDREAEPRFTGPPTGRGGYEGPPGRGGFGGGFGGGAPPAAGGGRQIFINNVCILNTPPLQVACALRSSLTQSILAPIYRWLARSEGLVSPSWYVPLPSLYKPGFLLQGIS